MCTHVWCRLKIYRYCACIKEQIERSNTHTYTHTCTCKWIKMTNARRCHSATTGHALPVEDWGPCTNSGNSGPVLDKLLKSGQVLLFVLGLGRESHGCQSSTFDCSIYTRTHVHVEQVSALLTNNITASLKTIPLYSKHAHITHTGLLHVHVYDIMYTYIMWY